VFNILGLNFGHDGTAAVLKDGRLACAISNERISRLKKAAGVTPEMIQYVLDAAGLTLDDIDYVALVDFRYQPGHFLKVLDPDGTEVTSNVTWAARKARLVGARMTLDLLTEVEGRRIKSALVNHHMAHAASTFYTSPFDQAACFTLDASHGQPEHCSLFAYGDGHKLHYHSCPGVMIGNAYSDFTRKLGLGPGLTKAGTTMALASFGRPQELALTRWRHYGQSYYARGNRYQAADNVFTNLMWSDLSGLPPHGTVPVEQSDSQPAMDIAAGIEYIFEQTILQNATELHALTKRYNGDNLCLAGGSFLNSNANMLVKTDSPFARVHLFPGCGDDGTAVGAALYLAHHRLGAPRVSYAPREYMYTGRTYAIADPVGEPYDARAVARALSQGQIVAFFHGGSEFGPRALGHRSLFADPRNPKMKDILNHRVKHREWFRPFAPIVLSEKASAWFDIDFESKLMLFIAPIREPDRLPAVAHVDGSARLQTMTRDDNPKVHALIEAFDAITGVPVILNTSLNDNGEPLVETPQDALRFFEHHDVDMLVLEDRLLRREPAAIGAYHTDPLVAVVPHEAA
jgi:carbamoyltransferase